MAKLTEEQAREKMLAAARIECRAFSGISVFDDAGTEEELFNVEDRTSADMLIELLYQLQLKGLLKVTKQTGLLLTLKPVK